MSETDLEIKIDQLYDRIEKLEQENEKLKEYTMLNILLQQYQNNMVLSIII